MNGFDTGARKFGDIATIFEIFGQPGRPEQRNRHQRRGRCREPGDASRGLMRWDRAARRWTTATTVAAAAEAIHHRNEGNTASRNAVVSRSMIITSTKSTVIQSLSNLKRDSSVSASKYLRARSALLGSGGARAPGTGSSAWSRRAGRRPPRLVLRSVATRRISPAACSRHHRGKRGEPVALRLLDASAKGEDLMHCGTLSQSTTGQIGLRSQSLNFDHGSASFGP